MLDSNFWSIKQNIFIAKFNQKRLGDSNLHLTSLHRIFESALKYFHISNRILNNFMVSVFNVRGKFHHMELS